MPRSIVPIVLLVCIVVMGATTPAWAAQLDIRIDPNDESSPFNMNYLKTVSIEYPNGGNLLDKLRDKEWTISGKADSTNPGVQELINKLNAGILADRSQARISDLDVSYEFHLKAREIGASIDFKVILDGILTNYVIVDDSQKVLVDLAWRGMTVTDSVVIDGVEINVPLDLIRTQEPDIYTIFVGTEAEDVLNRPLIDADYVLEQPMTNWHYLFDPTGINVDAETFKPSDEISGFVVSRWTMGESSIREGPQVERVFEAEIASDQKYFVKSIQAADQGSISIIGFGALDILDGVEIAGVTPTANTGGPTGKFPIVVVYCMAGIAAIAGVGFFIFSNRSLKNEKQGQQGIDPSRLVGYQTSSSAGGYQTNRGEAQLKDDTGYEQTRNVYEDTTPQTPPPSQPVAQEAACGCATSVEMGSECDCTIQGSCLCDAACQCSADLCREQVRSMS